LSEVALLTTEGQLTDTCKMVDHSSRGGTVIKKEVFCANFPVEQRTEPTRGSSAWLTIESLEHAIRAEIAKRPTVEGLLATGESLVAQDGKSAAVELGLSDGTALNYLCSLFADSSNGGTVVKQDLRCVPQ
jgi:hypothetical protein